MTTSESSHKGSAGMDRARRAAEWTREAGRTRTADMALGMIELQRKTFVASLRGVGKLQEQTGKMLHRVAQNASWVPDEGRQVVDEWTKATSRGREDFQKTMEKSFDLLAHYFRRVKKGAPAAKPAKAAAARKPRAAVKKKTVAPES